MRVSHEKEEKYKQTKDKYFMLTDQLSELATAHNKLMRQLKNEEEFLDLKRLPKSDELKELVNKGFFFDLVHEIKL
jgi:hypothetical protein